MGGEELLPVSEVTKSQISIQDSNQDSNPEANPSIGLM